MDSKELLIEIGTEELPAVPFLNELPNIAAKWEAALKSRNLFSEFDFHYTPRRLVLHHRAFSMRAPDESLELFGPPLAVAYKDGAPTKAAESFAAKCETSLDSIGRCEKDGKEVLYFCKQVRGASAKESLPEMVHEFVKSLHFGKSMRWGSLEEHFIRPIRWLSVLLEDEFVDMQLFGVPCSSHTFGHRVASFEPVNFSSAKEYFERLQSLGVTLSQHDRRSAITEQIKALEAANGISVDTSDEELFSEVVAITEYPTALIGSFEERFLKVPSEIIITSMRENQRYFPVFKDGRLANRFVFVSNAYTDEFSKVIAGNERVLRARLSDALFFYENDLKNGLNPEGLKNIAFLEGLGSVLDKTMREQKIAEYFAALWGVGGIDELLQAVWLGKADLLTEAVYEFGELQGIMGCYYAKAEGKSEQVANAIKEQYLPKGEDSPLPSSLFSAVAAVATKLDSIMGLFSLKMYPSGSKDPYALRRAAYGIVRIVLHYNLEFRPQKVYEALKNLYPQSIELEKFEQFFSERMYQHFSETNPTVVKAVLDSCEQDLRTIAAKVEALSVIVREDEFRQNFTTFKRVANISKEVDLHATLSIDEAHFEHTSEKALFEAFRAAEAVSGSFEQRLRALFNLRPQLDSFFDSCMVNAEDVKLRVNRKNLVASVYRALLNIADIKEISI